MKIAKFYVLIDVRDPDEYAQGHVEGAINLPVDSIAANIAAAVPDKNTQIFVYCISGRRAGMASEQLKKLGYTNVENLTNAQNAARVLDKGRSIE